MSLSESVEAINGHIFLLSNKVTLSGLNLCWNTLPNWSWDQWPWTFPVVWPFTAILLEVLQIWGGGAEVAVKDKQQQRAEQGEVSRIRCGHNVGGSLSHPDLEGSSGS